MKKREEMNKEVRAVDSRFEEDRALDTRIAEFKNYLQMDYHDPLYIPPEEIPPGVEYYWVRDSFYGVPDYNRIVELKRKQWTPVPATRHPDLIVNQYYGPERAHLEGLIHNKGAILMERPLVFRGIEEDVREAKLKKEMSLIPISTHMHDPTLGLRINDFESFRDKGARSF